MGDLFWLDLLHLFEHRLKLAVVYLELILDIPRFHGDEFGVLYDASEDTFVAPKFLGCGLKSHILGFLVDSAVLIEFYTVA